MILLTPIGSMGELFLRSQTCESNKLVIKPVLQ